MPKIKTTVHHKVSFLFFGLCLVLSGMSYDTQAIGALEVQKENSAHHQQAKKPKDDKVTSALQSQKDDFCTFYKIPKKKMKTKAYQELFLSFQQQEVVDKGWLSLMEEAYRKKLYYLQGEKREKAVGGNIFSLTVALKKQRINETKCKIAMLEKKPKEQWFTQWKSKLTQKTKQGT